MNPFAYLATVAPAMPVPPKLPSAVEGRVLLIDGDILAYWCCGNDDTPVGRCRQTINNKLNAFREITLASKIEIHLTSRASHKGYRSLIAKHKPYQGNRAGSKRPKNWLAVRQFLETYRADDVEVKLWHDREADDGISYRVLRLWAESRDPAKVFLASKDKDLRMITGCTHIDWDTYNVVSVPRNAWLIENPLDPDKPFGEYCFCYQLLAGDTVDNIQGIKGVGKVAATALLANTKTKQEGYQVVIELYMERESLRLLIEHSMLLWMRYDETASYKLCPFVGLAAATNNLEALDYLNRLEQEITYYDTAAKTYSD